ncbi:thioesterase family protein [Aquimarina sp. MMG016]|uniref:acyl-CoA thioesterase n=1 Tax=Aquimarina sp. MMG016 TaxID=2822690 RepID=UPI001B3A4352|nr:thioesterase family protein [Aquimarina sp. MMG016]MBQ4819409.1 thioesterase family protein [Aquimarina sp. MMG016]
MIYRKTYKVKGEDVNDFMVMQNFAYHSYASSIFKSFLFEKGYSKRKLNASKIDIQEYHRTLTHRKPLMFMQDFFVNMEFVNNADNKKISIKNRFFNTKNELCVTAITQLYWFDFNNQKVIAMPKDILECFLPEPFCPLTRRLQVNS